jgi:hypothetical protein
MNKEYPYNNDFLDCFDHIQRAEAPAYFQTRLAVKMEKELLLQKNTGWQSILKPIPVLAVLGSLVILNLFTLGNIFFTKKMPQQQQEASVSGFMNEYSLNSSVDINN